MATSCSASTRALISRSALCRAARDAVAAGGTVADLRRDAYGHGLLTVARAAHDAGVSAALVDGRDQIAALEALGIQGTTTGDPDVHTDLLYGLDDASGRQPQQVMRLTGRVMSLKCLHPGDAVSYGYTFRAASDTRVALVTGGYAQGVVRSLSNQGRVEIHGTMHAIVGRVAMDVCVVDIGAAEGIREGDEVTFFGGEGPARRELGHWSRVTGLTMAELTCSAGLSAQRGEED